MQAGLEGNSRPVGAVEDPALATVLKVFEHERIVAAMQALPERWRTVLWYAEVMDLPMHEISPLLGIEPYAVSALLTGPVPASGQPTICKLNLPRGSGTPISARKQRMAIQSRPFEGGSRRHCVDLRAACIEGRPRRSVPDFFGLTHLCQTA